MRTRLLVLALLVSAGCVGAGQDAPPGSGGEGSGAQVERTSVVLDVHRDAPLAVLIEVPPQAISDGTLPWARQIARVQYALEGGAHGYLVSLDVLRADATEARWLQGIVSVSGLATVGRMSVVVDGPSPPRLLVLAATDSPEPVRVTLELPTPEDALAPLSFLQTVAGTGASLSRFQSNLAREEAHHVRVEDTRGNATGGVRSGGALLVTAEHALRGPGFSRAHLLATGSGAGSVRLAWSLGDASGERCGAFAGAVGGAGLEASAFGPASGASSAALAMEPVAQTGQDVQLSLLTVEVDISAWGLSFGAGEPAGIDPCPPR